MTQTRGDSQPRVVRGRDKRQGDGLLEVELRYAHRDAEVGPLRAAVSVSVVDAPRLSDFARASTDRDLPHLRLLVEPSSGDVAAHGEIDAVFCNAAGYTSPCE